MMRILGLIVAAAMTMGVAACANAQSSTSLIPLLQKLAEQNNAEAIYHLGMAHHLGAGVPRDSAKALEAFRKATALGDPLASYKLGCYYDGQGEGLVEDDQTLALKYKLAAAEAGYALAQQDVSAIYYQRGELEVSLAWLGKAASQGWPDALTTSSAIYNGVSGIPSDPAKTSAYLRLAMARSREDNERQEWLAEFEKKMSAQDRGRAAEIVRNFKASPTALTVKGLSGQKAAQALVDQLTR